MDKKFEELKDLILKKEQEGKIVFQTVSGLASCDINEFIKQPVDGMLYDLNRMREVIFTYIEDPKWVNDYAVALVIRKLKKMVDVSDNIVIDWKKIRNEFFSECVEQRIVKENGAFVDAHRWINLAPHDMFEWFKKKIVGN